MSRADTQEHPLMPSFEKSPRNNIGPNFLVTVAFMPPVALLAPPAQKDLVAIKHSFYDLSDPSFLPHRLMSYLSLMERGLDMRPLRISHASSSLLPTCAGITTLTLLEDSVHIESIGCTSLIVAAAFHICT